MKKIILLSVILLSQAIFAQYPVWTNSFDTPADLQGWTFHDLNNNGNGWVQGQNIYHNGTSLAYGSSGVLRYSINLVPTGNATGFAGENDWIISPEIDLSNAGGTLTLAGYIGRQRSTHTSVSRDVYIFVSTPQKQVPELSDFQQLATDAQNTGGAPYKFSATTANLPTDLTQFAESLIDISAFAGKKIYIGLWSNRITTGSAPNSQNINIDEITIFASVLKTNETKKGKSLTKVMENPVGNTLSLQLNPELKENATKISIYNMAGQEILNTNYSKNINVSTLTAGTYIAKVSDGKITERVKFIKK
ncbi:Por secretion system C-terminal sorting domain-containing protein [Chryseobacterium taeanense]|uniref:Por secretion system C-terminal sorting domain-containing protein n=1 Tax=Chryseobacterium taeanense TaxID=311334 RepID=A0A1G8FXA5_9FLAO|nr:T9SS type A sorting domain-containing protein [Chryseobacterium taeanense]SDH86763.1 Por secretion system C-terminal sorting domain-containing protein [Chryseobacterium taeanense]